MTDLPERNPFSPDESLAPGRLEATLVESHHREVSSLLFGAVLCPLFALYISYQEGLAGLFRIGCFLLAAGVMRVATTLLYREFGRAAKPERLVIWKACTIASVLSFSTTLGLFSYFAIVQSDDPRLHLFALTAVAGYSAGTVGRNAGLQAGVPVQLMVTVLIVAVALAHRDDYIYRILAVVVFLYFMLLRSTSKSVHDLVVSLFKSGEEKEGLLRAITEKSERFDAALSNMPHGLAMVDDSCIVVVANDKFRELLKLPPPDGGAFRIGELFEQSVRNGGLPRAALARLSRKMRDSALREHQKAMELETGDGRTLELVFQPKARGGSVVIVMDVTDRKAVEKIAHLARHDKLTGLPNRRFFDERFAAALDLAGAHGGRLAVMALDLDRFKIVNDTLGHFVGDELLVAVSKRIRARLGAGDFVCRFGGDEFMLIHQTGNDRLGAKELARELIDAISAPYRIGGHDIVIGLTIGVAHFPQDGVERTDLLRNADLALYQAKRDGRGSFCVFESRMDREARERRRIESDLRGALDRDEFELAYQPIVEVATNQIVGCEALLRWKHPVKGAISPDQFLPIAEETGVLLDIGRWTLELACRDAAGWAEDKMVAVNLSAIQFRRHDIVAAVQSALAATGLAPNRLELEITEAVLLDDSERVGETLRELKALGVSIALDDFGLGLSSFAALVDYPIDKVKLDRTIIASIKSSPEKRALVRTIAALAGELRLGLVAEGVETAEELEIVQANPFQRVQGYFFSAPVPAHLIPWEGALNPGSPPREAAPKRSRSHSA
jgi:diguanylate cyclase (GGDEF)-like protein